MGTLCVCAYLVIRSCSNCFIYKVRKESRLGVGQGSENGMMEGRRRQRGEGDVMRGVGR